MSEQEDYGYKVFAEILSPEISDKMREAGDTGGFGAPISKMAAAYAFGSAWGHEGSLNRKEKSIAVISAIIAMHFKAELKNHIRIGLNNGLSKPDLENILIQLVPYVGLPAIAEATESVVEVLRERGLDQSRTSTERGLL